MSLIHRGSTRPVCRTQIVLVDALSFTGGRPGRRRPTTLIEDTDVASAQPGRHWERRRKAVIVEDHDIHAVTTPALAGLDLYLAWGTRDGAISNNEDVPSAVLAPYWPGPGGTRLLLVTGMASRRTHRIWRPARSGVPETDTILQGLIASVEVDDPGMHTSATLDYGIVVAGEMWLELDDGVERRLPQGTCVVQRGTRHRGSAAPISRRPWPSS